MNQQKNIFKDLNTFFKQKWTLCPVVFDTGVNVRYSPEKNTFIKLAYHPMVKERITLGQDDYNFEYKCILFIHIFAKTKQEWIEIFDMLNELNETYQGKTLMTITSTGQVNEKVGYFYGYVSFILKKCYNE